MAEVRLRPQAEADALSQARYLAADDPDVASRFVVDIESAFHRLTRHPHLGRPWRTRNRALHDVRRLVLSEFPISISYRVAENAIDVIRVLHHRRDFPPDLE